MWPRLTRFAAGVAAVGVVALAVLAVGWRLHGGRVVRVETASMGTRAPVGSLLWVAPVDARDLRVGDLITFHPPGDETTTYTHRIRAIHRDGTLRTQGMLTAPDPWRLTPSDVVGRVAMTWRGVGWLVRAAPVLLAGAVLVGIAVRLARERWRSAVALLGASLVGAAAIVVYRPFIAAQQLAFAQHGHHAEATYVSTGLLPIHLTSATGDTVRLHDGEVGTVTVAHATAGRFVVHLGPAVPLWFWIALVAACFVPAATATVVSRRH